MPSERQDQTIQVGMRLLDGRDYDTIVDQVAYGGFGVIAFGPNRLNGNRRMAYKTLRRELLDDPATSASFVREALLWIGIWDHPNIATALAVKRMGDARGLRPFIMLNYATGGNLRDTLLAARRSPRGRLPLELGLNLAQQVAAGLAYLHAPDPVYLRPDPTVHRDLKPENILLMDTGRAMITDFGLSKIIEDAAPETLASLVAMLGGGGGALDETAATMTGGLHTAAGVALGTPAYMPPEQWRDARYAGTPADMYAFGVILSELLAGRHALLDLTQRHNESDWRAAHTRPAPRLLRSVDDQIPIEVETLYLRLLAADPAGRPTAAQTLATLQAGARAAGMAVYEPEEIAPHTTFNEHVHWHNWSIAYRTFGRFEEAMERSDRALALARQLTDEHPELLADVLNTRGNIFVQLRERAEERGDSAAAARYDARAEAAYLEALNAYPPVETEEGRDGRSMVWHGIAMLRMGRDQWRLAEEGFAQALALNPDKADTFYARAANLSRWSLADAKAGRRADAVAHLRQARVHAVTALGMRLPAASELLQAIEEALRELGES